MIRNPILPGFHSDPCLCRRGNDYYLACSSFEWFPGVPVYHSRDLVHWDLHTHLLQDAEALGLRGLPSAKGIWAPCLTWCEKDSLFTLVYGIMRSMNARFFDIDNYLITAPEITGPWSEPVYLHSAGFDASCFHDDDGRKWIVSLEWETRDGYRKPGGICLAEYSPEQKAIIGCPRRIHMGSTMRGCLEGPHLYKRGKYYYLMCAEGGTGYYHCVTMARSESIFGPYEPDHENPILTSVPENRDESADTDHLKPRYYNPDAPLQKAGHGSLAETPDGIPFLAFHCARPFVPELCCTLGREAGLQRMEWTEDGWLRMPGGGNLVRLESEDAGLPEAQPQADPGEPADTPANPAGTPAYPAGTPTYPAGTPAYPAAARGFRDDFTGPELLPGWYTPRTDPAEFADLSARPGWVRLRGQQSLSSTDRISLLARILTDLHTEITTKMDFTPEVYQHSAGLVFYYDSMNYVWLRKTWSETAGGPVLVIMEVDQGRKKDHNESRIPVPAGDLWLRLSIEGRDFWFRWSEDGENWQDIGPVFPTWHLSDEHSGWGEFTGAFWGIACTDAMFHRKQADFDFADIR